MKRIISAPIIVLMMISCSHSYYVVRHAEKGIPLVTAPNDPPLSDAGKTRAESLKELLKSKKIRYIYSTNTIRTLSTAKPLSDAIAVPIVTYDPRKDSAFVAQLKKLKKNVLVVGHSNTIDDITNKLCNEKKVAADIDDSVYDNLFIVRYRGKKIRFRQEKY